MKIELVKFISSRGNKYYVVKLDGECVEDTTTPDLPQAVEIYEEVKKRYKKENTEIIISENI